MSIFTWNSGDQAPQIGFEIINPNNGIAHVNITFKLMVQDEIKIYTSMMQVMPKNRHWVIFLKKLKIKILKTLENFKKDF